MISDYLPLVHGLIDAFLFLEAAGPEEVNPDSAVRCLEHIASSLLKLQPADQIALRADFEKIASDERDPAYRETVRGLPDRIGLATVGSK